MKRYFRVVLLFVPRLIWCYFAWMLRYSLNPKKYPFELRYNKVRDLVLKLVKVLRIDFRSEGVEFLNVEKASLIVGNHTSNLDAIIAVALSPKPLTFVAKIEAKKLMFVNRVVKILEGYFIDRDDVKSQIRTFRAIADQLAKNEYSCMIFPEGTRARNVDGILNEFHAGSFKIAHWAKSDIVYWSSFGAFRTLKPNISLKQYVVSVKVNPPLKYDEIKELSTSDISNMVQPIMQEQVLEFKKLDDSIYN